MSAISDIMSKTADTITNRTARKATSSAQSAIKDPLLRSVLGPAISGAIDTVRGGIIDSLPGRGFQNALKAGAAAPGDAFSGIHTRGDAIQNWGWYALLPSLDSGSSSSNLPWYYIPTANLPQRTIQSDSYNANGHPIHFPESYTVDQLQLGFFMDTTNKSQEYLGAWQSLVLGNKDPSVVQNQGMWGLPADYKKEINIALLSPNRQIVLNAKYINCWPSAPAALDLSSTGSEALVQNVSFLVEDVYFSLFNAEGALGVDSDDTLSSRVGLAGLSGANTLSSVLSNLQNNALNSLGSSLASFF